MTQPVSLQEATAKALIGLQEQLSELKKENGRLKFYIDRVISSNLKVSVDLEHRTLKIYSPDTDLSYTVSLKKIDMKALHMKWPGLF